MDGSFLFLEMGFFLRLKSQSESCNDQQGRETPLQGPLWNAQAQPASDQDTRHGSDQKSANDVDPRLTQKKWTAAAIQTVKVPWARSVPTNLGGVIGTITANRPRIMVPLPTDVRPTRRTPVMPIKRIGQVHDCFLRASPALFLLENPPEIINIAEISSTMEICRSNKAFVS